MLTNFFPCANPVRAQTANRVLIVMTSREYKATKNQPTGYRLVEVAQAGDVFRQAGFAVEFASGKGGTAPVDSAGFIASDSVSLRFLHDTDAQNALANSLPIALVQPERYSVVFFVGGHGALWEFFEDPVFAKVAGAVHKNGGILATVGHGAAVLLTTKTSTGASILSHARLTSTTDEEEEADGFLHEIPYLLETALRRGGAAHFRDAMHASSVVADDRLITGQNSESARETAKDVVLKLELMKNPKK